MIRDDCKSRNILNFQITSIFTENTSTQLCLPFLSQYKHQIIIFSSTIFIINNEENPFNCGSQNKSFVRSIYRTRGRPQGWRGGGFYGRFNYVLQQKPRIIEHRKYWITSTRMSSNSPEWTESLKHIRELPLETIMYNQRLDLRRFRDWFVRLLEAWEMWWRSD